MHTVRTVRRATEHSTSRAKSKSIRRPRPRMVIIMLLMLMSRWRIPLSRRSSIATEKRVSGESLRDRRECLTQQDVVHDLSEVLGVPEHCQRNVKFALNYSVVDVSHHVVDTGQFLRVILGEGPLGSEPVFRPPPFRILSDNHLSYVGPMRERSNISGPLQHVVPVGFGPHSCDIRTPAILQVRQLFGPHIHRHKTASATPDRRFGIHE